MTNDGPFSSSMDRRCCTKCLESFPDRVRERAEKILGSVDGRSDGDGEAG